jgi:two-component system KDP operon response regulator KdpE
VSTKALVLVIESDPSELARTALAIEAAGYDTVLAEDGRAGLREYFDSHPDIVVVSLSVTGVSGWDVIERVRSLSSAPIIITSSEATVAVLQRGFDLQVDAFVMKPYDVEDLIARLAAVRARKLGDSDSRGWLYEHNGLSINWRSCEVSVHGQHVALTSTEFKLLAYLVQRRGWVLSHDQILSEVWGPEYKGEKDRVKLYVWYLRRKIEDDASRPRMILTKRGLGYTFVD